MREFCALIGVDAPPNDDLIDALLYAWEAKPMREITDHKVNGLNEALRIVVTDEPGAGNMNHAYDIEGMPGGLRILFQNGPIKESGVNGVSNEALLAIVVDRLRGAQEGDYRCRENALALTKLEEALHWLHHRTRARMARGVEGTSAK